MLMFSRKVHHLRHLGFSYLVSIDPAFAYSVMMNMQHNSCGGFTIFAEEPLQYAPNELHRCVIVVENWDTGHVWPLGLRRCFLCYPAARTSLLFVSVSIVYRPSRSR